MKYFLDFLRLLGIERKNFCEIRSVKVCTGYNDSNSNVCENERKERMIYIYDLGVHRSVNLESSHSTYRHKYKSSQTFCLGLDFTYFMIYSPAIGTQMHQSRIQELHRVEFQTQQVYLEKLVCVWTLLC